MKMKGSIRTNIQFISSIFSILAQRVKRLIWAFLRRFWRSEGEESLPEAKSPKLNLSHPTLSEDVSIWTDTSEEWGATLSPSEYIQEYQYLMTVPLAKDGCMTQWVLVDETLPAGQRTILASCETFRKRSIVQALDGSIKDTISHGIASVYCERKYRNKGYASRLLEELSNVLPRWQTGGIECVASILFSDIGGDFYGNRGWRPFPSHHVRFNPEFVRVSSIKSVRVDDLDGLCKEDEAMIRKSLAAAAPQLMRHMIIPDVEHMLWHASREKFGCEKLFGKVPEARGAMIGEPGNRVWVLWNHRYAGNPGVQDSANTLYILRLVIENQTLLQSFSSDNAQLLEMNEEQHCLINQVRDVIQTSQNEAAEWKLNSVELWDPSPQVRSLLQKTLVPHFAEVRLNNEICCMNWFGIEGDRKDVEWVAMEKYCWC